MSGCVVGRPAPSSTVSSPTSAVLSSSSIGSGSTPTTRTIPLPLPLDHEMRERFQARLVAKEPARLARVRERDLAGALERARPRDADERAVDPLAGERAANAVVFARGEEQRQGRRALAQVGPGDLAGLDRVAHAVEDVVDDLERDPERHAEAPEPLVARAEQARGLEQRAGLERDALEVRGLRGVRIVTLHPLQRLAAHERETRAREDLRALEVSHLRELAEGAREEIVARRDRSVRPVRAPDGLVPAPQLGAVDQVVVHERRRVDELDRDATSQRALAVVG